LVAPEQSADLRRDYNKHVKNDRLDSMLLARLPLLHPEGLNELADLGPADALKRAVRRRVKLVEQHLACRQRLDTMLDLLGPGYVDVLGIRASRTSLLTLERYGDPRSLRRLGLNRLTTVLRRASGGKWNVEHAHDFSPRPTKHSDCGAAVGSTSPSWRESNPSSFLNG
jgi:hypothetical protein